MKEPCTVDITVVVKDADKKERSRTTQNYVEMAEADTVLVQDAIAVALLNLGWSKTGHVTRPGHRPDKVTGDPKPTPKP